MYSSFTLVKKYLDYYLHAANGKGHGIHSPFVYNFVQHVLNDRKQYPAYGQVEALRKQLLHDDTVLNIHDLGAGSRLAAPSRKKVSAIARHVVKPAKFGRLLFRIAQHYQPRTILEMGTSLGVTTSYLALAGPDNYITTIEGAEPIAAVAARNFSAFSLSNVQQVTGPFDATLPGVLARMDSVDLAFVDGNHARDPTLVYFSQLLNKANNSSIIIFDDVHWSRGMEEAWETIRAHPSVTLSIDLFFMGLVFFREEFKVKQHFIIRY